MHETKVDAILWYVNLFFFLRHANLSPNFINDKSTYICSPGMRRGWFCRHSPLTRFVQSESVPRTHELFVFRDPAALRKDSSLVNWSNTHHCHDTVAYVGLLGARLGDIHAVIDHLSRYGLQVCN